MKTKSRQTTETPKKVPSVNNAGRDYAAAMAGRPDCVDLKAEDPLARFSQEEMHALGKEIEEDMEQRYRDAAAPCPKEYRPAYIRLLKYLVSYYCGDKNSWEPSDGFKIESGIVLAVLNNPELDPWIFYEIVHECKDHAEFAGTLIVLSALRNNDPA